MNVDGFNCDDVNECDTANGGCAQNCINSIGSHTCTCDAGYALNIDGFNCDDVNECDTANGGCAQNCNNTVGSFNCTCDAGYSLNIDGFNCDDNDECTLGTDNCHEFATCGNTIGSFTCTCNEGYYGDGVTCTEYPLGVCQKPEEIGALPYTHNSTTTGRDSSLNDYGLNCGSVEVSSYLSPDFVYSLDLIAGQKVEITLTPVEGFDAVLAVISSCGEDQDCVMYANENPAAQSEVLYLEAVSDTTYFIVVEGVAVSSYGSYTLDVKEWVEETDDDTVPDEDTVDEDIVDEDIIDEDVVDNDIVDDDIVDDDIVDDDIVDDDTVDEDSDILDDSDMSDDSDQSDESEPSDEDTGDTGDSGDTGDTGDTGNTGDTGDTGDTGNTGDTGDDADEISDEEEDADTETKDEEVYKLGGGGVGCAVVF